MPDPTPATTPSRTCPHGWPSTPAPERPAARPAARPADHPGRHACDRLAGHEGRCRCICGATDLRRLERIRARQRAAGTDQITPQQAVYAFLDLVAAHADPSHRLDRSGDCVACISCGVRLYQGELPDAAGRQGLLDYKAWRAEQATSPAPPDPGEA